eukprot:Tbor_TRINITY_DN4197_c0_g1::TRINITY_DN4197_c0_g1_i1::g.26471::m.26471/K16744/B9D1; B9 domain-containing protein 1
MSEVGFDVVVHGVLECAECLEAGLLYCRTTISKGPDWTITSSPASGERVDNVEIVTQMSERLPGPVAKFTWNAPFECSLRSTNISGWPQLGIQLTTVEGRKDVVVGYARCHIPVRSGSVTRDLPLMQPVASTPQQKFFGLFSPPVEVKDINFLCSAEDRVTMHAKRLPGYIRVSFNVMVTGQVALGYNV